MKSFKDIRIVFMGTPEFAVASLAALVDAGAQVVAVVTAPDKPAGRGMQLQTSAVGSYAREQGIPLLQPEKLKAPAFLEALAAFGADLQVVVAFRVLPEAVWNAPPMGTLNVHASLLPQYRGAAPINRVLMNGEKETGVTTFKLKHEIDTGDILLQERVEIAEEDNAGTLHDKLMEAGARLLAETVKGLAENTIREVPQQGAAGGLKHAPKIFKEDMKIDWQRPAKEIENLVRGLSPYPAAFTQLKDKQVKLYKVHILKEEDTPEPGQFETDHKTWLRFAAKDGWVYIEELQQEGKKKMDIVSFLRGFRS